MSKKLTEMYPLEQRYGSGVGGAAPRERAGSGKITERISTEQKLDSTDSIEVFQATTTKGKAAIASPKHINLSNNGKATIGLTLQVPVWTSDTVVDATPNYLQMILPVGQSINLPTTRIVDSLNSGFMEGTVVSNTAPNSNMYVDSGADTTEGFADDNDTTITFDDGSGAVAHNMFRVNDLIRLDNEICRITSIVDTAGDGAYTPAHFIVERALYGTAKADHTNNTNILFPFFNAYANYNKFTTSRTDDGGKFKAMNFFGYGRALTVAGSGIVPGSVNIKFYSPGYQEVGLSGISASTNSGLSASTAYYFFIAIDGSTAYEVVFTTDSSNVNFGGTNGIISKIQDILDTQYYTEGNLFEKKATVSIVNGDIRFTSGSRLSTSAIALTAGTSGTANVDELFDGSNQIGRIPATVETAIVAKLPDDVLYDKETYDTYSNTDSFMWDNGSGRLIGVGSGTIDYDTGAIDFNAYPNADFVVSVAHSSGLAGRQSSTGANVIEKVYARSTNAKVETVIGVDIE